MDLQSLVRINKLVLNYFVKNLQENKRVYTYLKGRLSEACIKRFRLGYAPYRGLVDFLDTYHVDFEEARTLGLIGLNEDGSFFSVFSNRVMIPIVHAGLLVGFAGRTFEDQSKAKYINSKTSILYKKNEVLFGLWYARRYIKETGFAIVLEGYFDWLSLFDCGILNVVGISGTALTDMHCTMLKRYTSQVGIMFDGDAAGEKAAKKTISILAKKGIGASILTLPKGMDPDDYIAKNGLSEMRDLINSGMGFDVKI